MFQKGEFFAKRLGRDQERTSYYKSAYSCLSSMTSVSYRTLCALERGLPRVSIWMKQAMAPSNRLGPTDASWCSPSGYIEASVYRSRREADNICQLDDVAHPGSRKHATFLQSARPSVLKKSIKPY
jgi:hypothetical protein